MNYDVFSGFRYANFRREASGISTKNIVEMELISDTCQ